MTMTSQNTSRRTLLKLAAATGTLVPSLTLSSIRADAYQGNMERAMAALQDALGSLQAATPNKGGHRERAMHLIERALGEVQAGIDFANAQGGGGFR
jgi:hypothetical protein